MKENNKNYYPVLEDVSDYAEMEKQCQVLEKRTALWILPWNAVSLNEADTYDEAYLAHVKTIFSIAEGYSLKILLTPELTLFSLPSWVMQELNRVKLNEESIRFECPYQSRNETDQACLFTFFLALFFLGKELFPDIKHGGENIHDFLQEQCIFAMKHAARRLKKNTNIEGFYFSKMLSEEFIYSYIKDIHSIQLKNNERSEKLVISPELIKTKVDDFKLCFKNEIIKKHDHFVFKSDTN